VTSRLKGLAAFTLLLVGGSLARAQPAEPDDDNAAADDADDAPDDTVPTVPAAPAKPNGGTRTYTIRAGDTLSTVSQEFLRDPQGWPKLWALNPQISNPHWIYPGQVVRLGSAGAPKETAVTEKSPEVEPPEEPPQRPVAHPLVATRVLARPVPVHPAPPRLRQLGFIDEGTLKASGTINGSLEEKIMLATGDQAYVQFPQGRAPKPPARYSVYQVDTTHPVREPGSSVVIGYLVHVCGELVIDAPASDRDVSSGHLMNLAAPVERGYRVGPLLPDMRQVAPKTNAVSLTARVIAAMDPGSLISTQAFVIVNRGRRHGVEVGNRFLVQRQGDGLKRMLESWDTTDPKFPPHTIAEILAVDVRDETTVGWIARGERELRVGDVADLQRGY
jgi:hypothetical protein